MRGRREAADDRTPSDPTAGPALPAPAQVQPVPAPGSVDLAGLPSQVGNHAFQRILATQTNLSAPRGGNVLLRSPQKELISSHTSWGDLDEAALGGELLRRALAGDHAFVTGVFDELGSTDRDDVALEFMQAASNRALARLVADESGRALLDRLFDELTAGSLAADEAVQSNRIMSAKGAQIGTDRFEAGMLAAKIFPFRLPGLTVFADAPITAERRPRNRIWVKQPVRVKGTSMFSAETRTLPTDVFVGGLELPEDEVVGVKMYDLGGEIHYRPALYLVQLSNETTTEILTKVAETAALGLSLGAAGAATSGMSAVGRAIVAADRIALAVGTIASVIREHRGWIIERFGDDGRQFLKYVDMVQSVVAIYGGVRALVGMGQLMAKVGQAFGRWRAAASSAAGGLDDADRSVVQQVTQQADEVLENVEKLKAQQPGSARPPAAPPEPQPPAPPEPASPPAGAGAGAPRRPTGQELYNKLTRLRDTPRREALRQVLEEAEKAGVQIHTDAEAQAYLDYAARMQGIPKEHMHACTLGGDIFVRVEHAQNVRVLREELIHSFQQAAGYGSADTVRAEIEARWMIIRFRHTWAITNDEVREMIREIRQMQKTGTY